jgi:hypothetical protein
MAALVWIILPVLVAAGAALLTFYIMQARLEVSVAQERELLAEARVRLESQKHTMEQAIRATEEQSRRKAMDEFLGDMRVEERHYVRENHALFRRRKTVILQERLFFRNIPLSDWVERELVVEEGASLGNAIRTMTVFGTSQLPAAAAAGPPQKLLGS